MIHSTAINPKIAPPKHTSKQANLLFAEITQTKNCVLFEEATLPCTISTEKKDGGLVREIDALDAQEECFVAVLKKKKLIQIK